MKNVGNCRLIGFICARFSPWGGLVAQGYNLQLVFQRLNRHPTFQLCDDIIHELHEFAVVDFEPDLAFPSFACLIFILANLYFAPLGDKNLK